MIPMSKVAWGPTDALKMDRLFSQKWIEPNSIKRCLLPKNWLISGEKGAGKSAIRRAIVELYGDEYIASPVVDFDKITFKTLHENLVELANATKLSKTATLSHYWQYAMIIELIVAAAEARPARYSDLVGRLPSPQTRKPLTDRLLQLLEDAWNKIDNFTGLRYRHDEKRSATAANLLASSGLSANFVAELSRYPLDSSFNEVKEEFFHRLQVHGDRVVLVLDGFDRLNNEGSSSEALRLIFASLIDAVRSLYVDRNLPDGLEIKAFIPHDRYLAITLRDADKLEEMHVSIKWDQSSLKDFLTKRMVLTPGLQGTNFFHLWRDVMPPTVVNSHYRIDEDSFQYILRHTMMRPRQLQIHLEYIASENNDRNVHPNSIPKAISESSKKVAWHFINEFRTEHPHLEQFIGSLNRADNVMEFKEFRRIIEAAIVKYHRKDEKLTVEGKVDTLYAMGFFGIVNFVDTDAVLGDVYCPPTREHRRYYVDFFYKNPHPGISSTLCDESVIALHPVFVDYASLRPHSSIIIG